MGAWLLKMFRGDGDTFLSILIRARNVDEERASLSAAFRAGIKIGLKHPHLGREVLGEPEYNI